MDDRSSQEIHERFLKDMGVISSVHKETEITPPSMVAGHLSSHRKVYMTYLSFQ